MAGSKGQYGIGASFTEGLSLTAPAMIVTIYGDIVVPRGGVLWIGNLIEICAQFQITETQVRTAVSRLVSAGRLTGIRDGRRSYYQLAEAAREEFDLAARLLYEPITPSNGWTILRTRAPLPDALRRQHFAAIANDIFIRPNHAHYPSPTEGMQFNATLDQGASELAELARTLWPLDTYASEYRAFINRFSPLVDKLRAHDQIDGLSAVFLRLLLVHIYRRVLLADPLLPKGTTPADWPGAEARSLFASAYLKLSEYADAAIGRLFEGRDATLPATTEATILRLKGIRAVADVKMHP
ncbi:PaaX family transcriptional regulator C-terminal domain-containing protein [Rhizobium helianthi]|uniref:PaaX family transcriptional regulator C-terminal domain-containing protein n=1 Tax=Rhizobium helianthi TaxID=1132695 RepID=A0ABW4M0V1_9HYPH